MEKRILLSLDEKMVLKVTVELKELYKSVFFYLVDFE